MLEHAWALSATYANLSQRSKTTDTIISNNNHDGTKYMSITRVSTSDESAMMMIVQTHVRPIASHVIILAATSLPGHFHSNAISIVFE